jgi:transcription elongation GreA/GreB family factor
VKKSAVIEKIIARLVSELGLYLKAARTAHAEATHEQSKAENKYDTRGLEASYLARGQSRQAAELEQSIAQFRAMPGTELPEGAAIDIGALVEVVMGRDHSHYLLGPRAGGTEVEVDGVEITVITPQSPLGAQLVGARAGQKLNLTLGGTARPARIASVR